jgi:glucose/arabinose dehydrogenase/mono/diheme cytochrome c family protein
MGRDMTLKQWAVLAAVGALALPLLAEIASGQQAPAPAAAGRGAGRGPNPQAQMFASHCAGCHGTDLSGARAPSLFRADFLAARSDAQLHQTIVDGIPGAGMPSFKGQIGDDEIDQLITYIRLRSGSLKDAAPFVPDPNGQVIKSQKQTFRIEVVASGLDTPWGEAFLPDGRMLVTERSGHIRIIDKDGKLLPDPVKGTPVPWVRQDGGYFDIAVHPDYKKNGWIYLSYSEVVPGYTGSIPGPDAPRTTPLPPSMTHIIRGRINANNEWVDQEDIYRAPAALYTPAIIHYGSRFLFDGKGHLYWTMGERGEMTNAQNLSVPLGKVHRINDDGSVPPDNPFVNLAGADPTIWSYGHRNPEGLSIDPRSGLLWESEHGPTGGDEINIIEKGKDYGWGVVTMGTQPGITRQHAPMMVDPIAYYTPSIGPSGIVFNTGNRYPGWKNSLFVAALVGQKLLRLDVEGRKIVGQETLFDQFGRVRDVILGPDGLLYVLVQNPTGRGTAIPVMSAAAPGIVMRLVPVN